MESTVEVSEHSHQAKCLNCGATFLSVQRTTFQLPYVDVKSIRQEEVRCPECNSESIALMTPAEARKHSRSEN